MAEKTFHSITLPGQDTARVPLTAAEFSTSVAYKVKDYCTYQGKLYRCTTAHAAGAWNAAHFTATDVDAEFDRKLDIPASQATAPANPRVGDLWIDNDENSPIYNVDASPTLNSTNAVQSGGTKVALNSLDSRKMEHGVITGDFSASVDYRVGDLVFYATTANGITTRTLYRCTTDHNSAAWNTAHFTATTLEVELQRVRDNGADTDMIGDLFGTKITYAVGDYCIYNDNLYRCIQAVDNTSVATPAFDPDDWTQVALANDVSDLNSALAKINFELESYRSSKTYAVGDYCEYNSGMYQCNTPITTAEAWNSAHWTAITPSDLIGDMNDRLDMVVTMQEVKQDAPETMSSQIVNPETMITYSKRAGKYVFFVTGKIPLDKDGAYYENPYQATSSDPATKTLYQAMFYDAYDQRLTLTRASDGSTVTSLTLFNTYGAYFVIENRRIIKQYVRGTLGSTYTADADIAYLSGTNATYFGYWDDETPVPQVGITYNAASTTYIPYDGGPVPELEYEWNYTVPMAQFVEAYMQTRGTAVSNNMFNFVYPERNNSEFANTLKYYQSRFDRQMDNIIRIGSFNKFISRGRRNWSTIKQELADYTLDICGFQESPAIVENDEITAQIGSALQGQQFVSYAPQNKTIGQALVSHWEIATTECLEIYQTDNVTSTCMHGIINLYPYKWYSNLVSNVCTLSVYVYHGRSQNDTIGGVSTSSLDIRKAEIDAILALVAQDTSDFIVIVGDTNCFESGLDTTTATHQEWEKFRTAGYTPVLEGYESTVTADLAPTNFFVASDGKAYCDACYDQIFIGSNIQAVGHSVVDSNLYPVESFGGVPVSDHCMIYADLKFDFDTVMNAKMVAELS